MNEEVSHLSDCQLAAMYHPRYNNLSSFVQRHHNLYAMQQNNNQVSTKCTHKTFKGNKDDVPGTGVVPDLWKQIRGGPD